MRHEMTMNITAGRTVAVMNTHGRSKLKMLLTYDIFKLTMIKC